MRVSSRPTFTLFDRDIRSEFHPSRGQQSTTATSTSEGASQGKDYAVLEPVATRPAGFGGRENQLSWRCRPRALAVTTPPRRFR
ncbi:hypothetical protein Maq22A_1p38440 (plasmid) [Methylobacterium aquaticum]|uniref:Uncharacterized protein n=1 Tax=Methylobacterium aquaticum TaxID=270351 RepID=A0A1Y0ZGG4_9HYPH|nr:hypothetical protein Maq22A_1p38440 [Methylobacterium aquaticum]